MRHFAELAGAGREALLAGDTPRLARLMDENFDTRRSHLPAAAVADRDGRGRRARCGASAKFAGSGGAIVGTYRGRGDVRARARGHDRARVADHHPDGDRVNEPLPDERAVRPWVIGLLFLAGFLWCLFLTRGGMAVTPDSGSYLAGAESLRSGLGYRGMDGLPSVNWPPGYAAVLAAISLAGFDLFTAARVVNAAALGFITVLVFRWVRWAAGVTLLAWGACVACLSAAPIVLVVRYVWSEPLFIALGSAGIFELARWQGSRAPWSATALLAAGSIVRFAGAPFLCLPPLATLLGLRRPFVHRIAAACGCALVGGTPILAFAVRNAAMGLAPLGVRGPSGRLFVDGLVDAARVSASWFLPWRLVLPDVGLAAVVVVAAGAMLSWIATETAPARRWAALVTAAASGVYTLAVVLSSVRSGSDAPDQRIMAPVFVLVLVMLCSVAAGIWRRCSGRHVFRVLVPIAVSVMLALPVFRFAGEATAEYDLGYNAERWRTSEVAEWAAAHLRGQVVFSEHYTALFIHHRLTAFPGPRKHSFGMPTTPVPDLAIIQQSLDAGRCVFFVRFDDHLAHHNFSTEQLEDLYRVRSDKTFKDGRVLEVCGSRAD